MADVPVPSIATATPDGDDTVLGVKDGVVKRFTLDNVGAGINFSNINATTNMAFNNAGVERMRITSAGNVGIGTTSPGARLDVNGNARLSNGGAFVSANSLIRQIESVSGAENQFTVGSIGFLTGSFSDNGQISFSTNAGSGNTERMRLDSAGNLAMTGGGVVDAASFRDYSNTAYYLDPANTGTSLNVAGSVIQGVNTTAQTLSANNTLTFSIVDNSTLRVSVRGSDGVTRTATIALT